MSDSHNKTVESSVDRVSESLWVSGINPVYSDTGTVVDKFDVVVSVCQDGLRDERKVDTINCAIAETANQQDRIGGEKRYEVFAEAASRVNQRLDAGRDVLLHCHAGVNRSIGVASAVIAHQQDIAVSEAISHIQEIRSRANPRNYTRYWATAWANGLRSDNEIQTVESMRRAMVENSQRQMPGTSSDRVSPDGYRAESSQNVSNSRTNQSKSDDWYDGLF